MQLPKFRHHFGDNSKGFTLIELLIVIGIIAILAVGAFVALDPQTRFEDSRDATRWSDTTAILDAVKVDQVDNKGPYLASIAALTADTNYMIGTCTTTCNATPCDVSIAAANGVDIAGLVTDGYLAKVPISPNGTGAWTSTITGYYLLRSSTGAITVGACESENAGEVKVQR